MGRDFSLNGKYPSVIINGRLYRYGKTPGYVEYIVENARYEKDYRAFKDEADLRAFLINLPESANHRERISAAYPDWHDVTPEQRDEYLADDRSKQRALAEAKLEAGTAQTYIMDLEGKHGPYQPQQVQQPVSHESPIERVERHLRDYKRSHAPPKRDPDLPDGEMGDLIHGLMDNSFDSGLSEAGKLRVLEGEIDWQGVSDADKAIVLAREVDFARVTPEQFAFVYEDIAFDKLEPPDATVARRLLFEALPDDLYLTLHERGGDFERAAAQSEAQPEPVMTAETAGGRLGHRPFPSPSQIVDAPSNYLAQAQQYGRSNDQDHGNEQ